MGWFWGDSQTTFTVIGEGGVLEMSTLPNKFSNVKAANQGGRGQKSLEIRKRSL